MFIMELGEIPEFTPSINKPFFIVPEYLDM